MTQAPVRLQQDHTRHRSSATLALAVSSASADKAEQRAQSRPAVVRDHRSPGSTTPRAPPLLAVPRQQTQHVQQTQKPQHAQHSHLPQNPLLAQPSPQLQQHGCSIVVAPGGPALEVRGRQSTPGRPRADVTLAPRAMSLGRPQSPTGQPAMSVGVSRVRASVGLPSQRSSSVSAAPRTASRSPSLQPGVWARSDSFNGLPANRMPRTDSFTGPPPSRPPSVPPLALLARPTSAAIIAAPAVASPTSRVAPTVALFARVASFEPPRFQPQTANTGRTGKPKGGIEGKLWSWLDTIPIGNGDERGWDDEDVKKIAAFAIEDGLEDLDAEDVYRRYVEHQVALAEAGS